MIKASALAEELVKSGIIDVDQMTAAIQKQREFGNRFLTSLIQSSGVNDVDVARVIQKRFKIPFVDLSTFQIPSDVLDLVDQRLCQKHSLIPIQLTGNILVIAFSDPTNMHVKDDLAYITQKQIRAVISTESMIQAAIEKLYSKQASVVELRQVEEDGGLSESDIEVIDVDSKGQGSQDSDVPIVKFVNSILAEAIQKKVSDIHIEPYEKSMRIRYRLDGTLFVAHTPPKSSLPALVSRLKIMSHLDIAESRRTQDGRLKVRARGRDIDFRVSVLPTIFGEKIVLRLLDKSNLQVDMTKLGFEPEDLEVFKGIISQPYGMLLITGPTGSGKTTTIYSALAELNTTGVNIVTAEDPVEFNLEGINQVQMKAEIDLTFASALRSFLRQDPEIIMVGEIRDLETAQIAFKAASTGHFVVSTLHTNDAPSTVIRLLDMGIPGYVVTSTINLIVAQRLMRTNCPSCSRPVQVEKQVLLDLGVIESEIEDYKVSEGKGCMNCNKTGLKGRTAIFEMMLINDKIKEAILRGASPVELRRLCFESGMKTLRRSALLKLKRGQVPISEVLNTSIKDF